MSNYSQHIGGSYFSFAGFTLCNLSVFLHLFGLKILYLVGSGDLCEIFLLNK